MESIKEAMKGSKEIVKIMNTPSSRKCVEMEKCVIRVVWREENMSCVTMLCNTTCTSTHSAFIGLSVFRLF